MPHKKIIATCYFYKQYPCKDNTVKFWYRYIRETVHALCFFWQTKFVYNLCQILCNSYHWFHRRCFKFLILIIKGNWPHTLAVMLFGGSNLVRLILYKKSSKLFWILATSFRADLKNPVCKKTPPPQEAMLFDGSNFNLAILEGHPGNTFRDVWLKLIN